MTTATRNAQRTEEVVFTKPHRHAGKDRAIGDKVKVTAGGKKKLLARDVIKTD